jgi:hypothetical protein
MNRILAIILPNGSVKMMAVALLFWGLASGYFGCNVVSLNENHSPVLAEVEGDYLFLSDLEGVVPHGLSRSDSIGLARNFINNWVKNRLMVVQAERNLTPEQLDFSKQLNDYRNSLIIYRYETLLIEQELDTVVTDAEIASYYQTHPGDFELKENILRAYFAIVNSETALMDSIMGVFSLPDSLALDSLLYFEKNVDLVSLEIDTTKWMSFFQFQQTIPILTYNQELFLNNNRLIHLEQNGLDYLVKVVDFKIKEDISPIEVERQDIRYIIINQRKTRLIKKVREDIYKKALYNNDFEVY